MTEVSGKVLIIRTDASTQIGSGHVMRCLALAQSWQDAGGHAIFIMAMHSPTQVVRVGAEMVEFVHLSFKPGSTLDARKTADLARRRNASWVVVDGYHFDAEYQRVLKDAGIRLMFIDDNGHADYYWADVVLNQNIHASTDLYVNRGPYTQLLLGTSYVLLRREFKKWREWERDIQVVARKVLVTLGSGDPGNATLKVIHALQQVHVASLEAVVVIGASNPHHEQLKLAVQESHVSIRLDRTVNNMPELMAWADVAVSAGGSTCWELAFMGLPSLVLVTATNQSDVVAGLHLKRMALSLGWWEKAHQDEITKSLRSLLKGKAMRLEMSQLSRQLVDSQGPERVLDFLLHSD